MVHLTLFSSEKTFADFVSCLECVVYPLAIDGCSLTNHTCCARGMSVASAGTLTHTPNARLQTRPSPAEHSLVQTLHLVWSRAKETRAGDRNNFFR